jgi:hypothetical protein
VLPLPRFVLRPVTALAVAGAHVYLSAGHLWTLIGGDVAWTHIWKGFGALAGAYIFAALASRGLAGRRAATFTSGLSKSPRSHMGRARSRSSAKP